MSNLKGQHTRARNSGKYLDVSKLNHKTCTGSRIICGEDLEGKKYYMSDSPHRIVSTSKSNLNKALNVIGDVAVLPLEITEGVVDTAMLPIKAVTKIGKGSMNAGSSVVSKTSDVITGTPDMIMSTPQLIYGTDSPSVLASLGLTDF